MRNDEFYGQRMRLKREKANVGLRELARRLDLSAAYLSDLELGRRHWGNEITERYERGTVMGQRNVYYIVVTADLYCGYCRTIIPSKDGSCSIVEDLNHEIQCPSCHKWSKMPANMHAAPGARHSTKAHRTTRRGGGMKIDEVITELERLQHEHGNVYVENGSGALVEAQWSSVDGACSVCGTSLNAKGCPSCNEADMRTIE